MKAIKLFSIALAAMLVSSFAAAQGKVVVFNMQAALMQTNSAQQTLKALDSNSDFAAMKGKFESLRAELISMDKDFQTNSMTWSAEQKADHRKKVEYKSADLKLAAEKLKAERNAVVQRIVKELGPKAKKVLDELVKAENIGLVLDSGAAFFATPEFDITGKVTAMLNKQ